MQRFDNSGVSWQCCVLFTLSATVLLLPYVYCSDTNNITSTDQHLLPSTTTPGLSRREHSRHSLLLELILRHHFRKDHEVDNSPKPTSVDVLVKRIPKRLDTDPNIITDHTGTRPTVSGRYRRHLDGAESRSRNIFLGTRQAKSMLHRRRHRRSFAFFVGETWLEASEVLLEREREREREE